MFITDSVLNDALKDALQRSGSEAGDLKPYWKSIISAANTAAYSEIVSAFVLRGYSKTIIDQWDRGAEFERAIGLWWCLEMGLSQDTGSYNAEALQEYRLDRRKELLTLGITIAGKFVDPDTLVGQAVTGALDTSNDLFVLDPNDVRIGQPTRL